MIAADQLNLSGFLRQQLEILYGSEPLTEDRRAQLVQAARESLARRREEDAAAEEDRDRARGVVRQMRTDRDAAQVRQDGIAGALAAIVGNDATGRYCRMLPENDPAGDWIGDWEALVSGISRRCGAPVDSAEVASGLRALVATKP